MGGGATRAVAHAVEQLAVGQAGRDEEDVVAADQLLGAQHLAEVVAGVDGPAALGVVLRPQLPLDDAAETLHGAGGDDALGRSADAEQEIDAGAVPSGHNGAGYVAVADELDPRACVADLLDELAVPWPV